MTAQSKKRLNPHLLEIASTSRIARGKMRGSLVFCSIFRVRAAAIAALAPNFLSEIIAALPEKIAAVGKVPH
ncbi:hypothetical protein NLM33_16810 [Bradyrhizobium sp. CCGUVB1N3]|uniref:hypothetical protein n=1 Tax=Bradyrhizobium sp. CCGUVB1N3 TaxID=2949629 RepID=UPI0020B34939|nr:hypothetical protein [Bradyrhizobium sp. CCGUVB1N3]MCP3471978.1 hypothetical protein [Bradyrhizobium sp. CCGUVB1N3]